MDKLTKEKRSWNMSRVKSKNTKPELLIRSYLHKMGYRFRLHVKQLPGSPDIVFPKYRAVIFVHGCFWHGHNSCGGGKLPKTRPEFWREKVSENVTRDQMAYTQLNLLGWRIAIVWECALKNKGVTNDTVNRIHKWIRSSSNYLELPRPNDGHEKAQ
jgi:DNA mismatch endonuclease (patch repair protein)